MKFLKQIYPLCFLIWLFSQILCISCVHTKSRTLEMPGTPITPYYSLSNPTDWLSLQYLDFTETLSKRGLIWSPFILPTTPDIELTPSDLLIGYFDEHNNFTFPPPKGTCKILQNEETSQPEEKILASFSSDAANPSIDKNKLFFLIKPDSIHPYALIHLNNEGTAWCYLPKGSYRFSSGFGSDRYDSIGKIESQKEISFMHFPTHGTMSINPSQQNQTNHTEKIKNGDLVRIGRIFQINEQQNQDENFYLPTMLSGDLLIPSNFISQKIGVDEFMQPSFLVGQTPYFIQLDTGKYFVAVVRKNHLLCLEELEIKQNENTPLSCSENKERDLENRVFNENSFRAQFDATLYPERFMENTQFLNWIASSERNIIFFSKGERTNLETGEKPFSFLYKNSTHPQLTLLDQEYMSQINEHHSSFPILGTSFEQISQGAIPFSFKTTIESRTQPAAQTLLQHSFSEGSNGAKLQIFEPILASDGTMPAMTGQRFRFRLSVPSWNSTHIVELYVNKKLFRRWVLDRGDISKPFSTSLETQTFENQNFVVEITARGEDPLPDFIFGAVQQTPYAQTRSYEVTLAGK